jgi:putative PIN family toxin of toxin-antitoxin system
LGKKRALVAAEPSLGVTGKSALPRPRVVLDTNCLVSSLIFQSKSLAWIRRSWSAEEFIPLVSAQTADELIRVMAYPKLQLSAEDSRDLLEEFLRHAEVVDIKPKRTREYGAVKTALTDPNDQIFLDLAYSGKTDVLVSGDKALLLLAPQVTAFQILNARDFRAWLDTRLWDDSQLDDDSEIQWE